MMKKVILSICIFLFISGGVVVAGEIGEIDIHGFISQGYLKSTENNFFAETKDGSFQFNEMGINFATWVSPDLSVGIQFFASDLGDFGNDEIIIDWAYADFRWKPFLGMRAGKIKIPMGLYNETRDIDSLRTSILLPTSMYLETARAPMVSLKGVGIYGYLPWDISYQFLAGTQEVDPESGIAKMNEQSVPSFMTMDITAYEVTSLHAGALLFEPGPLKLKVSYTFTGMDVFSTLTVMGTASDSKTTAKIFTTYFSAEYTLNDLLVSCEYGQMQNNIEGRPERIVEMAYVGGSNRFADRFEMGVYYSWLFNDKEKKRDYGYEGWLKDSCLSFKFDINTNWVAKLEGHYFDGTALMMDDLNPEYSRAWYLFAMKFSYLF